jgi:hypothetical protein
MSLYGKPIAGILMFIAFIIERIEMEISRQVGDKNKINTFI